MAVAVQGHAVAVQDVMRPCLLYWRGLMPVENIGYKLACTTSAHFNTKLMCMYAEAKPRKVQADWEEGYRRLFSFQRCVSPPGGVYGF